MFGSTLSKNKVGLYESKPLVKSVPSMDPFVLPQEKISIPIETKKVFAFCANGTPKSIQTLLSLAKENGEDELVFQTLLQCMSFSDQLLAYHEPELCDELCD